MRAVIGFLIAAVIVIGVAWSISILPGTWSATIGATSLHASTPVALTLLAAVFLVLYVIIRLLAGLVSMPRRLRRRQARVNRARGDRAVTRTLVALAAGDPTAARQEAFRSRRLLGDTPLTLLLAAQAGRQFGRDDEADAALNQLAARQESAFLGLRGLLRQAIAREDWPAAAALARRAEAAQPGAPWLQEENKVLALRTGNWTEALRMAGPDTRAALAVAAADAEPNRQSAVRLARQAWKADPTLPAAVIAYARRLRDLGKSRAAENLMSRAWAVQPHPAIATEYLAPFKGKLDRTQAADRLASAKPADPESHLMQAQAALEAGLTGAARKHVQDAHSLGMNQRRLWLLAVDIADQDGDAAESKDSLRRAALADPDPVWRCAVCGTVHGDWRPVCDACNTPARIAWVQPDQHGTVLPALDGGQGQFPRLTAAQDVEGFT